MNSHRTQKFIATVLAGVATGALFMLVNFGSTPQRPLMLLERVVIVGKSMPMQTQQQQQLAQLEQLPRVMVDGRRVSSEAPLLLAKAALCAAPVVC